MVKLNIPSFWHSDHKDHSSFKSNALQPISYLYHGIASVKNAVTTPKKSPIPVICIGNLTMGGTGKTPTSRTILNLVKEHGKFQTACFLMRGYGGTEKGPIEVDPTIHTAYNVGDEALMQAQYAPTIVSANRYKGARLARDLGYDLIIMDDGFQNRGLKKDLSLITIDGGFGFGNGRLFPAGPLREPVESGIKRAHGAIVINRTKDVDLSALGKFKQFDATIELINSQDHDKTYPIVAFAGIARPTKFFETLEDAGYKVHAHYSYPDHHVFQRSELEHIANQAKKANASIMTTEKDWIRLSDSWKSKISYLEIVIHVDDRFKKTLFKFLDRL